MDKKLWPRGEGGGEKGVVDVITSAPALFSPAPIEYSKRRGENRERRKKGRKKRIVALALVKGRKSKAATAISWCVCQ